MTTDETVISRSALYRLMTWLSPAFPVGSYTYSHGIEYAVEAGLVVDRPSLTGWVGDVLIYGSGSIDATFVGASWGAVSIDDVGSFCRIAERAEVFRGTAEMALESIAQGRAFIEAVRRAWPDPRLDEWVQRLAGIGRSSAYPVAVGTVAACAKVPKALTVSAYLQAFAAHLVSAAVKSIPLGQSDGLRALADLEDAVHRAARNGVSRDLDDIGTATLMVDWTSIKHETQYTRLYRS